MSTQIYITYKTAKRLKEFLGESAPEPMGGKHYLLDTHRLYYCREKTEGPSAYQLHDLLSKPFCEAMAKGHEESVDAMWPDICEHMDAASALGLCLYHDYEKGGLPAVEKALEEMMK